MENNTQTATKAEYQLPICGITGEPLEWSDRCWISTYVNGKLEQIPLYLNKKEVIKLHRQSPTYLAKKGKSVEQSQKVEDVSTEAVELDDLVDA